MGRLICLTVLLCLFAEGHVQSSEAQVDYRQAPGPKWGLPPANDKARRELNMPEHAGWQRAFSKVPSATYLGYSDGRIFVLAGSQLQAIAADDGSVLWQTESADLGSPGMVLGHEGVVYFNISTSINGVDSSTGRLLWEKSKARALSGGGERIIAWVEGQGDGEARLPDGIVLLNSSNGAELMRLHEGPADSYCQQAEGRNASNVPSAVHYALQVGKDIICFGEDGPTWRSSVENEDVAVQLVETSSGLLVAEYPSYSLREARLEAEGYREGQGPRSLTATIPNYASLRLLAWDDGREVWRSRLDSGGEGGFWWNPLTVSDEAICIVDHIWIEEPDITTQGEVIHFLRLNDGKRLTAAEEKLANREHIKGLRFTSPGIVQFSDLDPVELCLLDVSDGEIQKIPIPRGLHYTQTFPAAKGLIYLGIPLDRHVIHTVNPYVLGRISLDDQLQWITGEPVRHDFPQVDDTGLRAFIASADPQADPDLMRSIIEQGSSALVMLMDSFNELTYAQRDALLELCSYYDMHSAESSSFTAVQHLVGTSGFIPGLLHLNAKAELAPQLIRWFKSKEITNYGPELVTAIALCGGKEARILLDEYYSAYEEQELQPIDVPFKPYGSTDAPGIETGLPIPGTVGGNAIADSFHGLIGSGVFLLLDMEGDGWYEEVLPTGIVSLSNKEFFPNADIDSQRPRLLRLTADEVEFSYFREAVGPEDEYFVRSENYRLVQTRSARASFLLEDLRRDSDGDGLTDIAENEMFLDPLQADSDADGLSDGEDALPNVGEMGRLERGLARCLFWYGEGYGTMAAPVIPQDCCYLLVSGPVGKSAVRMPGSRFTICLNTEEERNRFMNKQSISRSRKLSIEITETERGAVQDLPDFILSQMKRRGEALPTNLADAGVYLSTGYWSSSLELVDVEGELYPAGYSNPPY